MSSVALVTAGITWLMAMATCMLFVILPERSYDLFKRWNELWGRDFEVLVKSKPRMLSGMRIGGIIGLVVLIAMAVAAFVMFQQMRTRSTASWTRVTQAAMPTASRERASHIPQ